MALPFEHPRSREFHSARLYRAALAGALSVLLSMWVMAADRSDPPPGREVSGPIREPGFDGFIDVSRLDETTRPEFDAARVRVLSEDSRTGRGAYQLALPAGYAMRAFGVGRRSIEIFVLSGELRIGSDSLQRYDLARFPAGSGEPALASKDGAVALMFLDPPPNDAGVMQRQLERGPLVTRFDATKWRPGVAAQAAGIKLALEVQDLWLDADSGARTWLLRAGGDLAVPWERHSVIEEGYLLEGDYRLAECLDSGKVIGEYRAGGYFRRAAGIVHSGPDSGTAEGVLWLMRTPAALDVIVASGCPKHDY